MAMYPSYCRSMTRLNDARNRLNYIALSFRRQRYIPDHMVIDWVIAAAPKPLPLAS